MNENSLSEFEIGEPVGRTARVHHTPQCFNSTIWTNNSNKAATALNCSRWERWTMRARRVTIDRARLFSWFLALMIDGSERQQTHCSSCVNEMREECCYYS